MFNKIINNNFRRRYIEDKTKLATVNLDSFLKVNYTGTDIKKDMEEDTELFRETMFKFARLITPIGAVGCYTYTAAVSLLMDKLGVEYELYAGLCIPQSLPSHDEDVKKFKERLESGKPLNLATHIYLVANDKEYEYFSGDYSGITKVHVIKVEV